MPNDVLVDVALRVTFTNVRKSQVDQLIKAVKEASIDGPEHDGLGVQVLELVGDMPYGPSTIHTAWQMPSCVPMPRISPAGPVMAEAKPKPGRMDDVKVPTASIDPQKVVGEKPGDSKPIVPGAPVSCERVLEFVRINQGLAEYQISKKLGNPRGGVYPHLKKLLAEGRVRMEGKRGVGQRPKYFIADVLQPAEQKPPAKPVSVPEPEIEAPIAAPAPEPADKIKKLVKAICHMNAGPEKDEKLKELIVEIIVEEPGISTKGIYERISQPTTTIRKFIIDLEEAKIIERGMVDEGGNSRVGYFLKATVEAP